MSFQENLEKAKAQAQLGKTAMFKGAKPKSPQVPNGIPEGFEPVQSTNIKAIAFIRPDNAQAELDPLQEVGHVEVLFHSGHRWRYSYLRRKDFETFKASESIGKHFHKHVLARVSAGELSAKQIVE